VGRGLAEGTHHFLTPNASRVQPGSAQRRWGDKEHTLETNKEMTMPLLHVVIILIVVGVLLWLVNSYIPMQATIKKILNAVVVIAVVLWLLNVFGLLDSLLNIHIGK
jgi:ABC-type long-subunit fatty acid transport system fused permease/ATPase subunit